MIRIRCQMQIIIFVTSLCLGYVIRETTSFVPSSTITLFAHAKSHSNKRCGSYRSNHFAALAEQVTEKDVVVNGGAPTHTKNSDLTLRLTTQQEAFFHSLDKKIYGAPFLERCRDLQLFKNENGGSCLVPKRYAKNPTLGNWVNKTRQMYRKFHQGKPSSMTQDRIDLLNDMGFIWSLSTVGGTRSIDGEGDGVDDESKTSDASNNTSSSHPGMLSKDILWMRTYHQMKEYIKSHYVNTAPPTSNLGVWAARQRREYQKFSLNLKSTMTPERVRLLNDIDFDWSPRDTKWNMRVNELVDYKKRFGDCCVPVQWKENPQLGRWVSTQRKYYKLYMSGKPSRISKERIIQLSKLGFVWNRWEDSWKEDMCQVDKCEDIFKRL